MRWKWFAAIGALIVVVLIAGVYAYLNSYDYNKLKPRIARMVKDATGRNLKLSGEIDLAIGFSPALVVRDVTLANAPWGSQPQMIKVEKLEAQLRLLPLLLRKVQLKRIGLAGVDVFLEADPNGQGNWDFITGHRPAGKAGGFELEDIEIDDVRIEKFQLTFREGKTGSTNRMTMAILDLARQEAEDELMLDLKADYNGQPVALSGKTGRIRLLLAKQRFPIELSGMVSNAKVEIAGAIDDVLNLQGIDLKANISGTDLAALGFDKNIQLPKTRIFDVIGQLRGSKESLTLNDASGNLSASDINLSFSGRIGDLIALSGIDLKLNGSGKDLSKIGPIIGQKLPTTDKFALRGQLTGSGKILSLMEAQGSANRGSLNLTLSGGIEELPALSGINFRVKASGKELAEIGPLVGAELPELGPFDLSGKLSGSVKAISLNEFSAMVDRSDFNGRARLEFLKRPKITIRLESSLIDFTRLMQSLEKGEKKPANKDMQKRRLFSDDPLPLDAFKKVDADILMKARNIRAKDARLDFGHLTLKLVDSDFSINKLEATYKKTKISGNLDINPGTPSQMATNFLVQSFNLGDFLKETGKSDQVRAIVDIAAHGKSRGNSVHGLMANLDGAIGMVMGEGYLTKYLDMLSSGLTQKVFQIWQPRKAADQIKCGVVQFDINAGLAASQAFVFDTRAGVLAGEGKINLGTEKINFLLVPKPAHPEISFLTNLRVSGSILEPHVGVDKASALTRGARALSALVAGPLGLLAPFVHLGANKSHPCDVPNIGQLGLNMPASK